MLNKKIFLLLLLLLPIVSAVEINNTLFTNSVTNYSIYINETITVGGVNVTDTGRIEFYNLDTTLTIGKFYNLNNTYDSVIDIFNLTNALIYYENRTVLEQEFTGDINISIPTLHNLIIMNNYIINDTGEPATGDNINQGGGGGDTKINNTLLEPLLIQIENLNNAIIYFSNGTILYFISEDINITISEDEFFYIVMYQELLKLNDNSGTVAHDVSGNLKHQNLSGATWDNDGVLLNLISSVDYTLSGTVLTLINPIYYWNEIQTIYSVSTGGEECEIIDVENIKSSFGAFIIALLGFLGVMGIMVAIVWLLKYLKPLFGKEGIETFAGN